MKTFIINKNIRGFYHREYVGGKFRGMNRDQILQKVQKMQEIEDVIFILKNDCGDIPSDLVYRAAWVVISILCTDLPQIYRLVGKNFLTVCVVPRAKRDDRYKPEQLYFRKAVKRTIQILQDLHSLGEIDCKFEDGIDYIKREKDTKTTHLSKGWSKGNGDLPEPYPGITKETCYIDCEKIKNKDILLIDDVYTKGINVDEDAIQALLDYGANSVVFYAIGYTIPHIIPYIV